MIWFACKACGKQHNRPVVAAGTLVFCSCGQGNRVPWESTVPAPETPPEPAEPLPAREPRRRRAWDDDEPEPSWRRQRALRRRDPAYCFNHEDTPSRQTCADCGEAFCERCVVTFQDAVRCGPCKNFRVRTLLRPPRPSTLAIVSLVVALLGAPIGFCGANMAHGTGSGSPLAVLAAAVVGLCAPLVALVLGLRGLQEIENKPKVGGRALAMTGVTTAAASLLWSLSLVLIVAVRYWTD
jgi:hypothetical protein